MGLDKFSEGGMAVTSNTSDSFLRPGFTGRHARLLKVKVEQLKAQQALKNIREKKANMKIKKNNKKFTEALDTALLDTSDD